MPTKIEWVRNPDGTKGETWNPITGCTKISEGCRYCYAERMARRLAGRYGYPEAPHHFDVTLRPERLEKPLRWRKPRRVFVCSMGDLFHEDVPYEFVDWIWAMMLLLPQHTFQVLTKRPERMRHYLADIADVAFPSTSRRYTAVLNAADHIRIGHPELTQIGISDPVHFPARHIWLGVTAENQAAADERIPILLQTPAAKRFVSCEPLLGRISLQGWDGDKARYYVYHPNAKNVLNWVIVGGESGPDARPMHPDWARHLQNQTWEAGVAYFHKQNGAWMPGAHDRTAKAQNHGYFCADGQWISKSQLKDTAVFMSRIGKKRAGRLLDRREWNEMPEMQNG